MTDKLPFETPDPESNARLEDCSFRERDLRRLRLALMKVNGLVLCSGPADSGKRTTLYACARHLDEPQRKLVTLERQLRGELPTATRLELGEEAALQAPLLMQSAMRAAADVIVLEDLVGELVLPLALRAALTSQLVVARLAAADTAAAFEYVMVHNPLPFHVTDVFRLVVSQRLVPRLCPSCRHLQEPTAEELEWLAAVASLHKLQPEQLPTRFYAADGCDSCEQNGRLGRLLIAELLPRSDRLMNAVREQLPFANLRRFAFAEGLTEHIAIDGIEKAAAGAISLSDLRAALRDDPCL